MRQSPFGDLGQFPQSPAKSFRTPLTPGTRVPVPPGYICTRANFLFPPGIRPPAPAPGYPGARSPGARSPGTQ
eukprot:915389-Rhodomonas_salina.1